MASDPSLPAFRGSHHRSPSALFWRATFLFAVVLWFGLFLVRPARLRYFGFNDYPLFIDSLALLSAGEAAELGYDVYRPIALDPYHRPHSYPSYWLALGRLGLTRADNRWFGPLTIALFGLALAASVRPATAGQCLEALGVVCSAGVMLAVSRANNDLWVFALFSILVPVALARSRVARLIGPLIVAVGAAMKYYPGIGGVVLLAEPSRQDRWRRLVVFAVFMLIVSVGLVEDARHFRATQPSVDQFLSFGAPLVLRQLGVAVSKQILVAVGGGIVVAAVGCLLASRDRFASALDPQSEPALRFILGAALLGGCFWTAPNWGYRWVFGLWLLPWFWAAAPTPRGSRSWAAMALLRWSWWAPLWFESVCVVLKRLFVIPDSMIWAGWWVCQGLDWIWFSALTAIVAAFAWRQLFGPTGGEWRD